MGHTKCFFLQITTTFIYYFSSIIYLLHLFSKIAIQCKPVFLVIDHVEEYEVEEVEDGEGEWSEMERRSVI